MTFVFAHAYEMSSDNHTYFTFGDQYFSFHIYDHLSIPCLAIIFIFANAYDTLSASEKYFTFGDILVLLIPMVTSVLLV